MGAVNTPTVYRISARGCGVSATPGRTNVYNDTPKGLLIFGGRGAQRIEHGQGDMEKSGQKCQTLSALNRQIEEVDNPSIFRTAKAEICSKNTQPSHRMW